MASRLAGWRREPSAIVNFIPPVKGYKFALGESPLPDPLFYISFRYIIIYPAPYNDWIPHQIQECESGTKVRTYCTQYE